MGLIRTSYDLTTEELAWDGQLLDSGWIDRDGFYCPVELALWILQDCEPSSPIFMPGVWYTRSGPVGFFSHEIRSENFHLSEWPLEEERAIFRAVKASHPSP